MIDQIQDLELLRKAAAKAASELGLYEWFSDIKLVEIYKFLHFLNGGDSNSMRHWMQTANRHLDGKVPANLVVTEKGINKVCDTLEIYYNY
jgi:hypothetical protein